MITIHDRRPVPFRPQNQNDYSLISDLTQYFPNVKESMRAGGDPGEGYWVLFFDDDFVTITRDGACRLRGLNLCSPNETTNVPIGAIQDLGLATNI